VACYMKGLTGRGQALPDLNCYGEIAAMDVDVGSPRIAV
jgi:hypothetical protein